MSNPFIKYDSISDIKVNNKKPFLGKISIGVLDIPDLENRLNNILGVQNLDELLDVNISSTNNNQVLKYDSTSSKWINSDASGRVSNLIDLLDVNISSIANNQVLKYDSTSSK